MLQKNNHKVNWLFFLNERGEAGTPTLEEAMAELTALKDKHSKVEKELEDTRMEVLTPEYSAFLEALDKQKDPEAGKKVEKKDESANDDDFEKLSKKELFERAKKAALDEVNQTLNKHRDETQREAKARTDREIAVFAKAHDDFETFRPIMYGLSLDPKNKDLGLAELYTKSKEHVKTLQAGMSEADKKKQSRMSSEKPGGDSTSLEKLRKMSNAQINQEALEEVRQQLGPIPTA